MKKYALIGVAGYIASRHLKAIKETGGMLVAALDKSDSVGIIDSYFPKTEFFTEFERFDRHLEKMKRKDESIDFVTICSPNYLHDAHVRFALRIGAEAICEKPLVLNPWNVTALSEIEKETGKNVYTIMQLRLHPTIKALKQSVERSIPDEIYDVNLTYITPRGRWYEQSWKGDESKSGGIATNIGIHFFDLLTWIFGDCTKNDVHIYEKTRAAGYLRLKYARVNWLLSINKNDLPALKHGSTPKAYRSIKINGEEIDFSSGFENLHTESYREILEGRGFRPEDVMASTEIVSAIRNTKISGLESYQLKFASF